MKRAMGQSSIVAAMVVCATCLVPAARAQDFINYRGPTANGTYPAVGLLKEWPKEGPPLLWRFAAGAGWAAPSIVNGKIYILGGGGLGQLCILDMDGKQLDRFSVGAMDWKRFKGSRSVPIVKHGVAVANAPSADYWGIDLATGEARWQVNAWKSFGEGAGHMGWGVPESPMLIGDKVVFNTCSRTNFQPAIVALDIRTGKTVWGMKTPKKYSAADVSGSWGIHNGRKLYFCPTWMYTICLDAETGELLWEIADQGEKSFVPLYQDGRLLIGDSKMALHMLELSKDGTGYMEVWSRSNAYSYCTHGAIVDGKLFTYGDPSIRATLGKAAKKDDERRAGSDLEGTCGDTSGKTTFRFMCLDARNGSLLQMGDSLGSNQAMGAGVNAPGTIIAADGMVYFTERIDGENLRVRLIRPTEKGFVEKGSFIVTDKPSDADERWVCPAVLEGRLFVRWGKMYCYDLRADPPWVGARNDGRGVYATASPPIRWSMKRNLAHSGALPAAGGSAPVASGSNVFVTVAPHTLLCLKSDDGAVVWSKPHAAKDAGLDFADAVPAAGAAFPTPVVAKNAVFAWFPNGVAAAYDMLGTRLWAARVAPSDRPSSPMLCRDLLVVPGKALTALNASTGKEAWSRAESAASAPVYVYANGGPALLTGGGALLGLWDGKELAKGILGKGGPFLLTADARESLVYAAEADGKKFDVKVVVLPKKEGENAKEVWSVTVKGSAPATAPLLFDGSLYLVGADRELLALDAKTGDVTGRLALDPDNASNADVEPHLVVAGRRLYVHNVGRANETVVVEPGPKPAILWRYGAEAAVTASGFHKDTQWIRSGASLWALAGKTPAEPVEPKLSVVEAQAFLSDADGKAPILPFTDKAVPTNWLFAGPCYPSTTMTNFLSRLGPIETVAPTDGLSVRAGYTTITFHFARTNDVWQMGKLLAFELTAQTSRKAGTIYAYTIVENDRDRYVEYNPLNPGQYWRDFGKSLAANTWLSGQQVDQGSVFLLKKGRHGLLIQAAVEKPENAWGRIFMTPHLLDVDESIRAKTEKYAKDKTFWTEYAKTKDEPIVLPTFLK